jgi:predicted nucleic acid-binding protein
MSSKIFIDTSILIEYYKGARRELFRALLADTSCILSFNQAVVSEYLFHHLGVSGGKAPLTLKTSASISSVLSSYDPLPLLSLMEWLPDSPLLLQPTIEYMKSFNLLPNDALILAMCKHHSIHALASYDPDFEPACKSEGIRYLSTVEDFVAYKAGK